MNTLVVLAVSLLLAGRTTPSSEPAWLGREVRVQDSPFCRSHGCAQLAVRQNTDSSMGWRDGQQVRYRLNSGAVLELDVRPLNTSSGRGRWISNARL